MARVDEDVHKQATMTDERSGAAPDDERAEQEEYRRLRRAILEFLARERGGVA